MFIFLKLILVHIHSIVFKDKTSYFVYQNHQNHPDHLLQCTIMLFLQLLVNFILSSEFLLPHSFVNTKGQLLNLSISGVIKGDTMLTQG